MRMFHTSTLSSLVAVALLTPILPARMIEDWPYDRLFKEADLVVIARATSSEASDDKTRDNIWKEEFLGVNTTFAVKSVLKGKCEGDKITLLHFRLNDEVRIQNGPLLVSFRLKEIEFTFKSAKIGLPPPDYLLFLKSTKDGRFEPVSGKIDPQLSVKEVHAPYRFLQDDAKKEQQPK